MPKFDQVCQDCGTEYRDLVLQPDELYPCPKCGAPTQHLWVGAQVSAHGDNIPGGMWIENLGPVPVKVYSHTERLAIAKSRGLQEYVRHVPVPGTDKSPHTSNWDVGGVTDPRPYSMLDDEEKAVRRLEAAERLGVTVETLEQLGGHPSLIESDTSTPTNLELADGPRDGGEFAKRTLRHFNIGGTREDAERITSIIDGSD